MYDPAFPRTRVFLPAILSGLLLYLSFFPVNAGFLAWIALVPVLSLVRANARPRRIYFAAFVGGLVCYVPAIQWMRVAHPAMYASWLFLAFCVRLFLVMSLWLDSPARPDRRAPLAGRADRVRRRRVLPVPLPDRLHVAGKRRPAAPDRIRLVHARPHATRVAVAHPDFGHDRRLRRVVPRRHWSMRQSGLPSSGSRSSEPLRDGRPIASASSGRRSPRPPAVGLADRLRSRTLAPRPVRRRAAGGADPGESGPGHEERAWAGDGQALRGSGRPAGPTAGGHAEAGPRRLAGNVVRRAPGTIRSRREPSSAPLEFHGRSTPPTTSSSRRCRTCGGRPCCSG